MTVAYSGAVIFYYELSIIDLWQDIGVFSLMLLSINFSLWFAIRYMDVGVRHITEIIITHLVASSLVAAILSYGSRYMVVNVMGWLPENTGQLLALPKTFAGYFAYALLLLHFYSHKFREKLEKKEEEELQLKELLHETELNLLKFQLNPHFIFNSLNSISSLTITNPEKARDMVVKLSGFLRYSLGKDKADLIDLEEEIHNLRLFADIERIRFGDRLHIVEEFSDQCLKVKLPPMILQPLIENAIKFSTYDTLEEVKISLSCKPRGEGVLISIKNPYDPFEGSSKGKGIGLKNVRQRLRLVYGSESELITETQREFFIVRMYIPKGVAN